MDFSIATLVTSSRGHPLYPGSKHQALRRGTHIRDDAELAECPSWEIRRLVTAARAYAVAHSQLNSHDVVFTAETNLILRGLMTWSSAADIVYRKPRGSALKRKQLRGVTVGSTFVPSVVERCLRHQPTYTRSELVQGLSCAPLADTVLDLVRVEHPLVAMVGGSSALRAIADFDTRFLAESRCREQQCKASLLEAFAELAPRARNRQGHLLLQWIDAGIESPGEAVLLWLLHLLLPDHSLKTQQTVQVGAQNFRLDILVEGTQIVIEFDGAEKLTATRASATRFLQRHRALSDDGFDLIRVDSTEINNPRKLLARLASELRSRGLKIQIPGSLGLTEPVLDKDRRF